MDLHYQSPWFVEALKKEENLKINELNFNLNCDVCIIGGSGRCHTTSRENRLSSLG